MKKLVVIAALAVSTLVAAASASAKEMTLLQVCGGNGCNAIKSGKVGHGGFESSVTRPELQSYYLLRAGVGDGTKIVHRMEMYFVPEPGVIVGRSLDEGWGVLPDRATKAVRAALEGLKPFRPQLATAYIGERRSVDPAPYAALLGPLDKAYVPSTDESPVSVSLNWHQPNPWSNDGAMLNYLVKAKVLMRSDGYFHVPAELAGRLDRERLGLAPVVPGGGGFPWSALAGSLAGALVLAATLVAVAWRRRPRTAEHTVPA